jgi:hypothetical protein
VPRTRASSSPILLFNKITLQAGRKSIIRFAQLAGYSDAVAKIYTRDKDLTQSATITNATTKIINPTYDRDHNDGSAATICTDPSNPQCINYGGSLPLSERVVRTYDYGTVATRYIYAITGVYDYHLGSGLSRLYMSSNGTTWSRIAENQTIFIKATFRYIQWRVANSGSGSSDIYLNTLEVFDPDNPNKQAATPELIHDITEQITWLVLDGTPPLVYKVIEVDSVDITYTEGDVII